MYKISKRVTAILLLIATLTFILSGCNKNTDDKQKLVVVTWGGAATEAQRKAMFEPFEKEYNCEIVEVTPVDYGKLQAMLDSGNIEWDVIDSDTDFAIRAGEKGLLEKMDYSVIDNSVLADDEYGDWYITNYIFGLSFGYNNTVFKGDDAPKNWKDFWNVDKFKGNWMLWKYPVGLLEIALIADGVDKDNLYPLDIDRAFKSLDKIKPYVTLWWTTGSQTTQAFADGSVVLGSCPTGRVFEAAKDGAPISLKFNETAIYKFAWIVPKNAPHTELAMKFIQFCNDAKRQAEVAELYESYAPVIKDSYNYLSEETAKRLPGNPTDIDRQFSLDYSWWATNYDSVNERFQEWLLK
jgi:putative spermidine/putrescine transport system substrate-binding protein